MDNRNLFFNTYNDLVDKIKSENEYQIIKSTELIRRLIFDSNSLVDKVKGKLTIEYTYTDSTNGSTFRYMKKLGMSDFVIADGFYPPERIANVGPIVKTNKDKFLKCIILIKDGKEYTVLDIIKFVLFCQGGTHLDNPKKEYQVALDKFKNQKIFSLNPTIYQIKSIGKVIIDALKPLETELKTTGNNGNRFTTF